MRLALAGLLLLLLAVPVHAASVQSIAGGALACPASNTNCFPIPLTLTPLCTAISVCPKNTSFSYTNSSRFWGVDPVAQTCRTSTDGGAVWGNCTTQPFTPAISMMIAGAPDGGVIAVGSVAGPVCTFRRSTDNGSNWTTVFTQAVDCSESANNGTWLYCLADSRCESIHPGVVSGTVNRIYRSSDNGVTWGIGETSTNTWIAIDGSAAWNGLAGFAHTVNASARAFTANSDLWANSAIWPAGPTQCSAPVIYNGNPYGLCFDNSVPTYRLYDTSGTVFSTLTLPNANLTGTAPAVALAPFGNSLYVIATLGRNPTPCGGGLCPIGIWLSRNNLVSFELIATTADAVNNATTGNAFYANGCIYFSSGTTIMFGKICV